MICTVEFTNVQNFKATVQENASTPYAAAKKAALQLNPGMYTVVVQDCAVKNARSGDLRNLTKTFIVDVKGGIFGKTIECVARTPKGRCY
jgi:hypothetical protein